MAGRERVVKVIKRILEEMFGEHGDFSLYTIKYDLLDDTVEDIQRLGKLSVLDRSPHKNYNVQISQGYNRTSRRVRTRMMESVNMM